LPVLPEVMDYAAQGVFSGANERNSEYSSARTRFAEGVTETMKAVLFDAQTSGGLLMAIPAGEAQAALRDLRAAGVASAEIVGKIVEKSDGAIRVLPEASGRNEHKTENELKKEEIMTREVKQREESCCAHAPESSAGALEAYRDFLGTAMAPGELDEATKELLAIALGLAVNCVPCTRIHIGKAKKAGVGKEAMEEAAALAVAFAGCRALMLWNDLKKELL